MLKKLQKLMMLCLMLVGISMNASAFKLTLDYPAQGNVASIGEVKLSMPAGMETAYTGYTLTLSGPGGNENVYFDCGSLGFLGLITKPSLNITTPGTYTLTIAAGQITDYYTSAACEAQTFTWTIGGGSSDPDPDPTPGPTTYTVTVNKPATGCSSMTATPNSGVEAGTTVTLSQTPATGYQFNGWSVNNGAVSVSNNQFEMPASNVTVTGSYSKINYTITKGAMTNGSVTCASSATYGQTVTVTPNPASGYMLQTLTVTNNSTHTTVPVSMGVTPTFTMPAANVTVNATFALASSPSGWTFDDATFTPALNTPVESIQLIKIDYNGIDPIGTSGGDNGMASFTGPVGTISNGVTTYQIQAGNDIFNAGYLTVEVFDAHGRYTITEPGTWTLHFNAGILRAYAGSKPTNAEMSYTFIVAAPASAGDDVNINPAIQYATYYNSTKAVELPAGVEGYVFGIDEDDYSMTAPQLIKVYDAGDVVPAGEPVVLTGSGDKTLNFTTTANSPVNVSYANLTGSIYNYLVGFDNDGTTTVGGYSKMLGYATGECYFYALSLNKANETSSVGFYWMAEDGAAFNSAAHKAYLCFPKEGRNPGGGAGALAPSRFLFKQGEATAISEVKSGELRVKNLNYYNLNGQRVNASAKGIVIMNGKKVVK